MELTSEYESRERIPLGAYSRVHKANGNVLPANKRITFNQRHARVGVEHLSALYCLI